MGSLSVGDYVIGRNGKPTRILGCSEITEQEVYEVELHDGGLVECSPTHKWTVYGAEYKVLETQDLVGTYDRYGPAIPRGDIVEFDCQPRLTIHPYALGALLAEGGFDRELSFSSKSGETVELLRQVLPESLYIKDCRQFSNNKWAIQPKVSNGKNVWKEQLKELGLWGKRSANKFIPRDYLFSSVENRTLLLQGLYDGDGLASKLRICTISPQLATDIRHLIRSLGGYAGSARSEERLHTNGKTVNAPEYFINFWVPESIQHCQLVSKKNAKRTKQDTHKRPIKAVRKTNRRAQMRCIAVDAVDNLYVVDNFMVTHNSTAAFRSNETYWELDDQVACVPLDTEILTREGWKTYDQLETGQDVLGYNGSTDQLEWTRLEAVHTYGPTELVRSRSKSFDFITTYGHKWALQSPDWATYNPKFRLQALRWGTGIQQTYVVLSAELDAPTLDITADEAALIAWVLTDGSCAKYERGWHAGVQQTKFVEEVRQLLDRLDAYTQETIRADGMHVWNLRQPYFRNLLDRAGLYLNKHRNNIEFTGWEQFVLGLSIEARKAFCEHGYLAEGSVSDRPIQWKNGTWHEPYKNKFCQSLGPINEAFRLAYFLTGKYPTVRRPNKRAAEQFTLSEPRKWTRTIETLPVLDKPQPVWCPQTTLGTWVMRQNRQIVITGNSYVFALKRALGLNIRGFIIHEQRKDYPQPPTENKTVRLGRRFSVNKQQATDYQTYKDTVAKDDTSAYEAGFYDDHLNWLRGQGTEYYRRFTIYKTDYELEQVERNLTAEALDMTDPNLRIYPMAGQFSCRSCAFQIPCISKNSGQDFEYSLNTLFVQKLPYYRRSRPASTESKGHE